MLDIPGNTHCKPHITLKRETDHQTQDREDVHWNFEYGKATTWPTPHSSLDPRLEKKKKKKKKEYILFTTYFQNTQFVVP